jgi:hypothetical protein
MNKHTPGPWYVALDSDDDLFVSSDDGKTICEIANSRDFINSAIEGRNNARLIAAAPDLLAALEEVTRCLAWHERQHGVGMDRKAIEDARAAIVQATKGGTP